MKISERERRILAGQEHLTVSQWAERHRIVTTGHAQGLWKNETTPYLVEPMDTWNAPWVRHIILCFAPQIGKTSVALNCLLYSLDQDPGPAMYLMPDEKGGQAHCRQADPAHFPGISTNPPAAFRPGVGHQHAIGQIYKRR
jgi:phage terminase large subunit GpA-like protein